MTKKIEKIVLSYSGGLDTSIILKWLQETYGCEVVTFTADLGQGEELEPARKKAEKLGVKDIRIVDVRRSLFETSSFRCCEPTRFMKGNIFLAPPSLAR